MSENKQDSLTYMALPAADGKFMVLGSIGQEYGLVASCVKLEDARRIVACVNACSGIDTELLEIIADNDKTMNGVIANVERQRDELLAALEGLHKVCEIALAGKDGSQHAYFETRAGHFVDATKAMQAAESAIASVTTPEKSG